MPTGSKGLSRCHQHNMQASQYSQVIKSPGYCREGRYSHQAGGEKGKHRDEVAEDCNRDSNENYDSECP